MVLVSVMASVRVIAMVVVGGAGTRGVRRFAVTGMVCILCHACGTKCRCVLVSLVFSFMLWGIFRFIIIITCVQG